MRLSIQALLVGLFVVALSAAVQADIIAEHVGSTDPASEEFTHEGEAGAGVDDSGTAAWNMTAQWGRLVRSLSTAEVTDMKTNGWAAEMVLRNGLANYDPSVYSSNSMTLEISLGGSAGTNSTYALSVGSVNGDPTLWQFDIAYGTCTTLPLTGVTGSGYHTYRLLAAPDASTAAVYVDGLYQATISPNDCYGLQRIQWAGSGDPTRTAPNAYYASVKIESSPVPEPSTIALMTGGLLGLLAYAWRKRR